MTNPTVLRSEAVRPQESLRFVLILIGVACLMPFLAVALSSSFASNHEALGWGTLSAFLLASYGSAAVIVCIGLPLAIIRFIRLRRVGVGRALLHAVLILIAPAAWVIIAVSCWLVLAAFLS